MSVLRTMTWVLLGLGAIHGYIFLQTEEVNPCSAATKRLIQEYHLSTVGFAPDYLDALPGSSGYGPHSPQDREITAKSETLERFGVVGCYVSAVLGWRVIPPITNSR
jgi:hypothetical protein